MSETLKISPSETEKFLQEKYGSGITDVKKLGSGAWSHAFTFEHDGSKNVIRWSNMLDNFERDAVASSFNRDGLPVPQITEIGQVNNRFFAIAPFIEGTFLDTLSGVELEKTLPSVLKMFRAIRSVDLASASGFGIWNKERTGSHASWKEFLLDDKDELKGSLIRRWKKNLEKSPMGIDVYKTRFKTHALASLTCVGELREPVLKQVHKQLWEKFEPLVASCPEDRNIVHSDLLNFNVLVSGGKISAVLDWGSSFYGDSLYDIAWFLFYEPWYPHFKDINLAQRLLEDFKADPTTNKKDIDQRLLCYKLHIGLDSIAYNSFKEDWEHAKEAADYTMKIGNMADFII